MFYFYDLGLRNYAIGAFGNVVSPHEMGLIFENFVFNILKEKFQNTSTEIHFWRTKDGAEVDFVIDSGKTQFPEEVKYRELKGIEMSRSFRSFIEKYHPKKAYIINLGLDKDLTLRNTKIYFIPFFKIYEEF